jgi:L-threonylcarbamoyladenylate synthase
VDLSAQRVEILREGGIASRDILDAAIGEGFKFQVSGVGEEEDLQQIKIPDSAKAKPAFKAPGQLKSHYAPKARLFLHSKGEMPVEENAAYLFFSGTGKERESGVFVLSQKGDTVDAAARLFQVLHEIDALKFKVIHAERAPDEGLGPAINDRLQRAGA